ncbi:hypothetical protein [Paraburkholderia elongata]|uniref:Uncharacterized protein n=1 Tax=Paraburkholderia elongata TaxID=2675747 RepID=A0A972NSS5_9BURK|nr:hypothetical protein [Paraburkholderia elongata]NPT59133.1 hypothetical protein [Paraburkholderia elongata]
MTATAGLLKKIVDLGCSMATEEQLGLHHFRLTVDDEYVEAARKLVYESVPVIFRVDVVGASEPRLMAIAPGDWLKFKEHYDNETPCEVGGRLWLVRSIEFETGPVWRGQVGLVPHRPVGHEWRGPVGETTTQPPDDTKPNHARDAVRANQ